MKQFEARDKIVTPIPDKGYRARQGYYPGKNLTVYPGAGKGGVILRIFFAQRWGNNFVRSFKTAAKKLFIERLAVIVEVKKAEGLKDYGAGCRLAAGRHQLREIQFAKKYHDFEPLVQNLPRRQLNPLLIERLICERQAGARLEAMKPSAGNPVQLPNALVIKNESFVFKKSKTNHSFLKNQYQLKPNALVLNQYKQVGISRPGELDLQRGK